MDGSLTTALLQGIAVNRNMNITTYNRQLIVRRLLDQQSALTAKDKELQALQAQFNLLASRVEAVELLASSNEVRLTTAGL